jgi:DNA-binding NtrC family response regulator
MMATGEKIDLQDLPPYLQGTGDMWSAQSAARLSEQNGLEEQERLLLVQALEESGGNQSQAARKLKIGRDALRYKIKKHGLENIS